MRALQKLTQKGNSYGFSVPRPLMVHLGWLPGESFIIELLEDQSLRVRRPTGEDFAPIGVPRVLSRPLEPAAK